MNGVPSYHSESIKIRLMTTIPIKPQVIPERQQAAVQYVSPSVPVPEQQTAHKGLFGRIIDLFKGNALARFSGEEIREQQHEGGVSANPAAVAVKNAVRMGVRVAAYQRDGQDGLGHSPRWTRAARRSPR